jgi:energy-coupling factor transport system ATP-binding protein
VTEPLIRVEDISYAYPGDGAVHPALRSVSLTVNPGELIALIGQNGAGKSTLARHLNGLLKPASGRVLVGGVDTREVAVGELAERVGYVFQNPDHQLFLPTVRREVIYGPEKLGLSGAALEARVRETLERFDLVDLAEHHPAMLGRGLRRLTALAAVYAMGPRVLVLDEPTGGLDGRLTGALMGMLGGLVAEGRSVVLITHEMDLAAQYASRVIALRQGQVIADEPPERLFDQPDLLASTNLQPPDAALLASGLRPLRVPEGIATVDAFVDAYERLYRERGE